MNMQPQTPDIALAETIRTSPQMTAHFRAQIMEQLLKARPDECETMIRNAVIGFGGTLIEPCRTGAAHGSIQSWGPFDYQLDLLQCSGTGDTMPELAADWAKAAWRMLPPDAPEVAA